MSERLIIERRARATGTLVNLVHSPDADPDQPWETICVEHGGVCSHETRKLAEGWLSHPDEWCEDCMYGAGALDGSGPVPYDPTTKGGSMTTPAYDEAREDYASLADEMNDYDVGPWVESDWDERAVANARRYAAENGLPFPPGPGDYDRFYEEVNS